MIKKIYPEEPFTLKKYSGNAFKWEKDGELLVQGLADVSQNHNYLWEDEDQWGCVDPRAFAIDENGVDEYEELIELASNPETIIYIFKIKGEEDE
jgi:hypothetical protein